MEHGSPAVAGGWNTVKSSKNTGRESTLRKKMLFNQKYFFPKACIL